jgi:membrane fusion protein (multidrug efflux system)
VRKTALLIPQRAVTQLQGAYQVAVLDPGNKVSIRSVDVGQRVDTMWVINKGLNSGDRVVAEGTLKVKDGTTVNPIPFNGDNQGR